MSEKHKNTDELNNIANSTNNSEINKQIETKNTKVKSKDASLRLLTIAILLVLIVMAALGSYAFARYVTSRRGTEQAPVAGFHFELKNINGDSTATAQSGTIEFPITRTDENTHVQTGLLAPDTYGRFDMIIDATGTEVAYRYDIDVTVTNCPTNLLFYTDKDHTQPMTTTRTESTVEGETVKTAKFTVSKYVPLDRVKEEHKEIVYWNWLYETGTGEDEILKNDLTDSADMNKTVTMSIVATGSQVLEQPDGVDTVGEQKQTVEIVKLDVTQVDNTTAILASGTQAEVILSYTQTPDNLEDLAISSSDSSIATATVDLANNKVIINALKKGTATITLRGEVSWNITKTINVTVEETVLELGDYVDLDTNYITETTYDDGTTIEEDWRVFYVEPGTGYVWLIMSDYLPNSTEAATAVGLKNATESYGVNSSYPRANLINGLDYLKKTTYMTDNGVSYTGKWKKALFEGNSKLSGNEVTVAGAVDLETWIASWNTGASTAQQLDYQYYSAAESGVNTQGYKVKKGTGSLSTSVSGLTRTGKTLYFPRTAVKDGCYGYWLASPSANYAGNVMHVYCNGSVNSSSYSDSGYGVRPAVRLPSYLLKKDGNVWKLK